MQSNGGTILDSQILRVDEEVPLPLNSVVQFCSHIKKYVYRFSAKEITQSAKRPNGDQVPSSSGAKRICLDSKFSLAEKNKEEFNKLSIQLVESESKYKKLLDDKDAELKDLVRQNYSIEERFVPPM